MVAFGVALGVLVLVGGYFLFEKHVVPMLQVPHLHGLLDRLTFALRCQLVGLVTVTLSLFHVSLTYMMGFEAFGEKANNILVDTVEQFILTFMNQLILASYLPEVKIHLILLANLYFFVGRMAYFVGYLKSPYYRAFGLTVSGLPSVVMVFSNCYYTWTSGPFHMVSASSAFASI